MNCNKARLISAMLVLLAFSCVGCAMLTGTPLENAVHAIQIQNGNCFTKAMEIGRVRTEYGLQTHVVIACATGYTKVVEGEIVGGYVWHAFWRDEKGHLQDVTTIGTVLATPMFEFEYKAGMVGFQNQDGAFVLLAGKNYIAFQTYDDGSYLIFQGNGHVRILAGEPMRRSRITK